MCQSVLAVQFEILRLSYQFYRARTIKHDDLKRTNHVLQIIFILKQFNGKFHNNNSYWLYLLEENDKNVNKQTEFHMKKL